MSNWYVNKKANTQLGMTLGRWLVLFYQGQPNEAGVKNDITNAVTQSPVDIDTGQARQTALMFFTNQTKQQPDSSVSGVLDQWLSMVDGQNIAPNPQTATETPGAIDDFLIQ